MRPFCLEIVGEYGTHPYRGPLLRAAYHIDRPLLKRSISADEEKKKFKIARKTQ